MAPEHHLLTIPRITATHLRHGEQTLLTTDAPLNVFIVEVPPNNAFPSAPPAYGAASAVGSQPAAREGSSDSWLVLSVGDIITLPLSAVTRVVYQQPASYIIPWEGDGTDQSGAGKGHGDGAGYVRIELAPQTDPEDRDTLDGILAGWTTFAGGPGGESAATAPVEKSSAPTKDMHGHLALINERTGQVVGDLSPSIQLKEDPSLVSATPFQDPVAAKEPVVITLSDPPTTGSQTATVSRLSQVRSSYGQSGSTIVNGAEWISRGVLFGSEALSNVVSGATTRYVTKHPPTDSPMVFNPSTRNSAQRVQDLTRGAVAISGKAAGIVGETAAMIGDRVGKATGIQRSRDGQVPRGPKGFINKSLVAVNTVFDALEHGGKHLLASTSTSANTFVQHQYGDEAAGVSRAVTGTVTGVALVYIDIRGITRKAILKSAGKAAIRGRMTDGREVVLAPEGEMTLVTNPGEKSGLNAEAYTGAKPLAGYPGKRSI